jgi:hypothetical protein
MVPIIDDAGRCAIPWRESPRRASPRRLVGMSYEPTETELKQLIDRWVAQWNEPDPDERRRLIREVWAADGYQVMVNPPEGIRETAAQFGVPFPAVEIRGHDAMYARVTRAYDLFVAPGGAQAESGFGGAEHPQRLPGGHVFERDGEVVRHAGAAVALTWLMRSRADGSVAASGLEVLTFDADGRVRSDHEFVA